MFIKVGIKFKNIFKGGGGGAADGGSKSLGKFF
jgi:hypothetical protein